MITLLSDYEFLGNSIYKFNANMNELNVRYDRLYNNVDRWNSLFTTVQSISSELNAFVTEIPTLTSTWKTVSDLVYNIQGFWEEPLLIVYKNTFNMAGNFTEVRNWLTENFSTTSFPSNQLIKCDFLCKNYGPEKFQQYPYAVDNSTNLEIYSKTYGVKVNEVYTYLSYLNQLNSIKNILNSILTRNSRIDLTANDWTEIVNMYEYVGYSYITKTFISTELSAFSELSLQYIYSYLIQYKTLKIRMDLLIDKGVEKIPDHMLKQFVNRNLEVYSGGSFYFKNIENEWELYPYAGNEYCTSGNCSDCYSLLDINSLYTNEKPCFNNFEYILEECYEQAE